MQAQLAQAQAEMAQRGAMAEIGKTEAEAERARAAAAKDMASIGKMRFDAAITAAQPMNTAAGY